MSIWGELQYLPLGQPHFSLLTAIYFVLVAWILVRALRLASTRIGLGTSTGLILLAASLAGSYLNIPVAQLPQQQIISGQVISFYGMYYVVPTVGNWPGHGDRSQCWRRSDPGIAVFLSLDQISALASGRARDRDRRICLSSVGAAHSRPRHRAPGVRAAIVGGDGCANTVAPACTSARLHRRLDRLLGRGRPPQFGQDTRAGCSGRFDRRRRTFDGIFLTGAFAVLLASIFSPSGNLDGKITRATL